MLEGYWRALWPLIVLAHAREILMVLGAVVALSASVWWGVRRKRYRQDTQDLVWKARRGGLSSGAAKGDPTR